MRKRTKKKLFDAFKILMAIVMTVTLLNVSNYSASATEIAQEDTVEEVMDEQEETLETEEEVEEEEAVEEETTEEEEVVEEETTTEEETVVEEESVEATETKTEYVYEDSKVKVTVKLQEGTTVDANAELSVKEIKEGTDAYNNAISKLDDDDAIDRVIYDISFISNGEEVEPDGKVDVAIEFIKNVLTLEDEDNYTVAVTHITDDGDVETLEADVDTNDGEVEGVSFTTSSFSEYVISLDGTSLKAGTYGNYTLSYNEVTDAFENSSYYNASSLLGVAGNFHLVGFGTVTLSAHTNGNVLAYELIAGSNFGTNGLTNELSYVQKYTQVNATSASSTNHTLVLGSYNTLTTADNGNALAVNDTKLDKPYNIIQDTDTDANPYIDLDGVKSEIETIAETLSKNVTTNGVVVNFENNNNYITLADSSGASYINLTADEINALASSNGDLKLQGFTKNSDGTLIINVNCSGVDTINMPNAIVYVDGNAVSTNEVTEFSNGKVIWNFINTTSSTVINAQRMTGMILAPNATVNINQNLNGTVVATNINVKAESHRTDFTGTLTITHDATKTIDGKEPTDEKFTFNLYELSNDSWKLIDTKENSGSAIKFDDITYTATGTYWYLMQEEAGTGSYDYSTDLYLVKVIVSNDNSITNTATYYKVSSTITDITKIIKADGTIDESVIEQLTSKKDVVFNNRELISVEGSKGWADTDDADVAGETVTTVTMVLQRRIGNETWETVTDDNGDPVTVTLNITDVSTVSFKFEDLYKYDENGNLYEYRVRELDNNGDVIEDSGGQTYINNDPYEVNYYDNNAIINEKENVQEIDGHKRWLDNQDGYGTRPDSVTVVLLQSEKVKTEYTGIDDISINWVSAVDNDGNTVASQTINESDNNWQYSFKNLDDSYYYVVREVDSSGNYYDAGDTYTTSSGAIYTVTYNDTNNNIYNTLTDTTSVAGTKVWHDNSGVYETRPATITIQLQYEVNGVWYNVTDADGKDVTKTISKDTYGFEFTNLDKYDSNGVLINYRVVELASNGDILYDGSSFAVGSNGDTYVVTYDESTNTITNTLTGTTEVSGIKTWNDNNNSDRKRPTSITVWLRQNGSFYQSAVVTADDNWEYTFTNLPKYDSNGELYTYMITEEDVENYVPSYTDSDNYYNLTNTYETEKTSVNVTKTWVDNSNQDGYRPSYVEVELYAGNTKIDTVKLDDSNSWFYRWSDLDKYDEGVAIIYTVKEVVVDSWGQYYTTVLTGSQSLGYDIINTHETETTEISGTKTWYDDNNRDGIRPTSITVGLFAKGLDDPIATTTATEVGNWEYSFTNLPAKSQGQNITYYVREIDSSGNVIGEGETLTVTGGTYTVTYDDNYNITNTHKITEITISGTKTWVGDTEGVRPTSITLYLYGDESQSQVIYTTTVTADEKGNWTYKFENLPKYENGGQVINYVIVEGTLDNYVPTVIKDTTSDDTKYTYDITNTYTFGYTSATVEKVWNDDNNRDGIRPESIEVTLQRRLNENSAWEDVDTYEYNGTEYKGTVQLSAENNWFYRWLYLDDNYEYHVEEITSNDLPIYTVDIKTVSEYLAYLSGTNAITDDNSASTLDNDFVIINSYTPQTTNISGTKTWTDDGTIRPSEITVNLLADGKKVDSQTITANDKWSYKFENLPVYSQGTKITYTVEEEAIAGYEATVTDYDIENKQTVGQLTFYKAVEGKVDVPANTVFELKDSKGNILKTITYSQMLTDSNGNKYYTFDNLPLGETYILEESGAGVANYTLYYTTSGFDVDVNNGATYNSRITLGETEYTKTVTLTNIYKQGSLDITKTLSGYVVSSGETLEYSFIVQSGSEERDDLLYWGIDADGIAYSTEDASTRVKVTVDSTGSGTTTLKALPITTFTVSEDTDALANNDDYTLASVTYKVDGNETQTVGASYDGNEIVVTNTYTTEVSGTKTWVDGGITHNNATEISLILTRTTDNDSTVYVVEDYDLEWNGNTYTFSNLPAYDSEGNEYTYTVRENNVTNGIVNVDGNDYEVSYDGNNITNTLITSISGTKIWNDDDNRYGTRPESITVELYANDVYQESKTVTTDDNWEYLFDNLDKYDADGNVITYTIKEAGEVDLMVDGIDAVYDVEYDGYNIINTLQNTGSLVITKTSNGTSTPDDAVFTIYYAGTDEALTFIYYYEFVDGVFRLDNIPVGEYTVVESDAEIDGYTLEVEANSIAVTIKENSETSIEFVNNYSQVQDEGDETTTTVETTEETETTIVEDNVQTSDDYNIVGYAGLIFLAAVAFFLLRKKKHVE